MRVIGLWTMSNIILSRSEREWYELLKGEKAKRNEIWQSTSNKMSINCGHDNVVGKKNHFYFTLKCINTRKKP